METQEELYLNKILSQMAEQGASDLHLSAGNPPYLRLHGKLIPLTQEPILTIKFLENIVLSWLDKKMKEKLASEKEVIFSLSWQNKARFKVAVFYEGGRLSASLKLIPNYIRSLKELGLPDVLLRLAELKKGLVIIAGPFGSGKTTTLAAFVNHINMTAAKHIITLEKPIEYLFIDNNSIIEQREVGRDTPSFAQGLKFILEEDVDVVFISDLEEKEVWREVFNVVNSGRLVLGAMDADSAIKVLQKIINLFPQEEETIRGELAQTMEGIVVQKLLPRRGGGQVLALEILLPNAATRNLIRSGDFAHLTNVLQTSRFEGMLSFDQSIAELLKKGEITEDVAYEACTDAKNLASFL